VMVATLVDLLGRLIGEDMTIKLVARSLAPSDTPNASSDKREAM